MGFIGEELIAQTVTIWEGIYAAELSDDTIGVSIPNSAPVLKLLWNGC